MYHARGSVATYVQLQNGSWLDQHKAPHIKTQFPPWSQQKLVREQMGHPAVAYGFTLLIGSTLRMRGLVTDWTSRMNVSLFC